MFKIRQNKLGYIVALKKNKVAVNVKSINPILNILPSKEVKNNDLGEPFIHKQKKSVSPIKTIKYINNDTGKTRHFTPAAQEWFNSFYSFNKNNIKLLPSTDKNVIKLLKTYFNFFLDVRNMHSNPKLLLRTKTKSMPNRYRKLSANKVFVGKGELKHTNDKVIITKYIYNAERLHLRHLAINCARMLYYEKRKLKKYVSLDRINWKEIVTYNRPFTLKEYLKLPDHPKWHKNTSFALLWKQYVKLIGLKKLKNEEKKRKKENKKLKAKEKDNMQFIDKTKLIFSKAFSHDFALDTLNSSINLVPALQEIRLATSEHQNVNEKEKFQADFPKQDYNDINDIFLALHDIKTLNLPEEELLENEKVKKLIKYLEDASSEVEGKNNVFKEIFNTLNPLLDLVENKEENKKKLIKFKLQVIANKFKYFSDFDSYMIMAKQYYEKAFKKNIYLLMVNSAKLEIPFATKLLRFLEKIYNKEVELNIVSLNKMHLNSDIYTQAVALKLKNRDNKLFRVLTWSLNKAKLPNVSRITEKFHKSNKHEFLINKIRNKYINSMFLPSAYFVEHGYKDPLNTLLLGLFSSIYDLKINIKKRLFTINRTVSLYRYIFATLKQTKLAGIRVEAKGRLTRRFTASRSVFKMRWKGGLKNVDSSFKGLSAIMLRGDRKSNVEYSIISSKNRNGAYGVKGWVSSK